MDGEGETCGERGQEEGGKGKGDERQEGGGGEYGLQHMERNSIVGVSYASL